MYSQSAFPLINTCAFQPQFPGTSAVANASTFSPRDSTKDVIRFPFNAHAQCAQKATPKCAVSTNSCRKNVHVQPAVNDNPIVADDQPVYDVFLGGSCGKTVWRQDLVIPYLKKRGITYYDPQRPTWSENMIYEEALAKENSRLFLFVLDPGNINATSFLEIAYLSARKASRLVVVFLGRREWSDKAHPMDLPDRIRTCHLLEAILKRHSVPMLTSITSALDYVDEIIIGKQSWKSALTNPLQCVPFLQVKSTNIARNSCRLYKQAVKTVSSRFGVLIRRACVVIVLEAILASLLILLVFKSAVPVWAVIMPIFVFDYLGLIAVFFYCRFKARQSKEKVSAKLIISGTPIPRMTKSAALLKSSNTTTISSFANGNGIYKTKIWKQTSTDSPSFPCSTSFPEDIAIKNTTTSSSSDNSSVSSERFPRRRSSAKSKTTEEENGEKKVDNVGDVKSNSHTNTTREFAQRLVDSTVFIDMEVRCDLYRFNGCGRRILHQCSVCNAGQDALSFADSSNGSSNCSQPRKQRQRRDTIAISSASSSRDEDTINDVPRTISICEDAAQWTECEKCFRREKLTMNSSFVSPIGYDVFLSCSSSNELDWITQKALPQLHKSGLSYTSALMCDKEMRIPMLHTASHILYYIPSYKTFLSGMIEIAYFIGHWDWQVTVCVPREAECLFPIDTATTSAENRNISPQEHRALYAAVERRNECYRMAFSYLKDMAQRRQCRVFTRVEDAIKHIANDKNRSSGTKPHFGGARLRQIVEKQHLVKTGPIDVEQSRLSLDDSHLVETFSNSVDLT